MSDQTIAIIICVGIPGAIFYAYMAWIAWGKGGIFRKK